MNNCSDFTYTIYFTDAALSPITVAKSDLDVTSTDIALVGKTRFEYGEIFNENILHILEKFASISNSNSPNPDNTYGYLLEHPINGQFWFNKSSNKVAVYSDESWKKIYEQAKSILGISGTVAHGELVPLPIGVGSYTNCHITVSPFWLGDTLTVDAFDVHVNRQGYVTAKYTINGEEILGIANYALLYIEDSISSGLDEECDGPVPSATAIPTPTPTPTATISATPNSTPTSTPQPTRTSTPQPTPSITPEVTPTATPTITVTPSVTGTLGASPTPTPTFTVTPTSTAQVTPTPTVTSSVTPEITPSATAEVTPEVTPTVTAEVTPTATVTPTVTAEVTPTLTPTITPTVTPDVTPTVTITPTITPTPSMDFSGLGSEAGEYLTSEDGKIITI